MFSPSNGVKQGGVLSPILFNIYLDDLIQELKRSGIGCHFNNHFVGCFIYADDITILAPSCEALDSMLGVCSEYADTHDILFNPSKTKCMFFDKNKQTFFNKDVQFMNKRVEFVEKCRLLGSMISRDILDRDISSSVNTFNRKCNELKMDFSILSSDIKAKLLSSFCMDLHGCQLWNFSADYVNKFYVAWRKSIRNIWGLLPRTHCNLLHVINSTLPIDIMIEKRTVKFIWSCINSRNDIVKSVALSSIRSSTSVLGENYRYFSYKYRISPITWCAPLHTVFNCITDYVSHNVYNPRDGYFVRELCISRDLEVECILTSTEMSQLIEYICTI
jgi:hypothetical protein